MDDQQTCGKGLAENAALPAALGEVMAAVAGNLEVHMTALDVQDDSARLEYDVYQRLAELHRSAASQLREIADQMASDRDLPMGKHDMPVMTGPAVREAFQLLVTREEELAALLAQRLPTHHDLLQQMSHGA